MRLIDADALLKEMDYHFRHIGRAEEVRDMINSLPTLESSRDWTPCAEGMPEDSPDFQSMSRYECTILIPDGTREVFTLQRTENGRWLYETGKGLDVVRGDQVAAWRKMPEPYLADDTTGKAKEDAE